MRPDPKAIVEAGYDAMADDYAEFARNTSGDPRLVFLADLQARLDDSSAVADLGCGSGLPCTRLLAERHDVLGIDLSAEQLRRARANVPSARFVKADYAVLDLPAASLDAVTAFYSLTHVPRREHEGLFRRIAVWLKPGGYLLATLSAAGESDGVYDFVGMPMFFSGHCPDTNRDLLAGAGFELIRDEIATLQEPDGSASFQWVLARRRGPA